MKKPKYDMMAVFAAVTALFASCAETVYDVPEADEKEKECEIVYPVLDISVSDMAMAQESRAVSPMSPDLEKYVKYLAVFEFDNEGLHDKSSTTYHFIDFLEGTVDGAKNVGVVKDTEYGVVETKLTGIPFKHYTGGTLCFVANVTEDEVKNFYDTCHVEGQSSDRITFDQFTGWSLPFVYLERKEWKYEESVAGHLKDMYMFGYYQGNIDTYMPELRVDLGRLASRMDITVINETGRDIEHRFGYHFDKVCRSAYFFPMKKSVPEVFETGLTRTVICSGLNNPVAGSDPALVIPETFPVNSVHTRYFYVPAHSALNESEATKLHLFWNSSILENDQVEAGGKDIKVPLCNVHPSHAAGVTNGYSLSRNTRYHFTIRLKSRTEAKSRGAAAADYSYDAPGEISVYLPMDDE